MCNKHRSRQRGLTIIELVMFIVIMGVAAAGILQVLNMASRNSADPILRKQAMLIAEAYMEEVQLAAFTFCDPADANAATAVNAAVGPTGCATTDGVEVWGPEAGNLRPFDNINDYVPRTDPAYVPGTPVRAFAAVIGGNLVDIDVAGNALGAGAGGTAMTGFVTTLALTPVSLGPGVPLPAGAPGRTVVSNNTAAGMEALQITITVTWSTGTVTLDGYRTRYVPNYAL